MRTFTFRTIIEPDEGGTFHGYAPTLSGCHTWGKTLEETRANLRDAMKAYLASLVEDGEPIPEDVGYETLETVSFQETVGAYA
ncbi:MAG: type II toxin-antitoxin system HicB family antitoxin [bacterium]|nr:type II toxin-antitoxin system HicB family antitoxin [bacterium]